VYTLLDIFNEIRQKAWAAQPTEFFAQARIDADGTLVVAYAKFLPHFRL
jgi:hypothetical protein